MSECNPDEETEKAKRSAEFAIVTKVSDTLRDEIVLPIVTSLDGIVYSACGGDTKELIAVATLLSLAEQLEQNPVDLLDVLKKNLAKPT